MKDIQELSYASCISIEQVKSTIKHLEVISYDVGGIYYNVCTEYDEHQDLNWFHIIIFPVGSLYHSNSTTYKNHTNGNLIYKTDSLINNLTNGGK
tara:strand:+ start:422 stop:706 length:285 start_codon:yes stop_codon:yes gene_type:complete